MKFWLIFTGNLIIRTIHVEHNGEITCKVPGGRRQSDIPQGSLEVPCEYNIIGKKKYIKKIRKLLK